MLDKRLLKGVFYLEVTYSKTFLGTSVGMSATLILLWLGPSLFRWINDRLIVWWLGLPTVMVFVVCLFCLMAFRSGPSYMVAGTKDNLPPRQLWSVCM